MTNASITSLTFLLSNLLSDVDPICYFFIYKNENGKGYQMNAKTAAKQVIDGLPKNVSMDDVIHALYVATKFNRGDREIRSGKGISDEEAKLRMKKWQR